MKMKKLVGMALVPLLALVFQVSARSQGAQSASGGQGQQRSTYQGKPVPVEYVFAIKLVLKEKERKCVGSRCDE